ncbi:hypothetical protein Tco_1123673 [Tanacetum coccineum]|uniref:Uncharacterized protein n=1 Tax=Tanacetum coccineum TaxID=301880 RepID=A0ABQ5J6S5_9ASTR
MAPLTVLSACGLPCKIIQCTMWSILAGLWGLEVTGTIAKETGGMLAVCVGIDDDDALDIDWEAENKSPPNIVVDGLGSVKDEDNIGSWGFGTVAPTLLPPSQSRPDHHLPEN